MRNVTVICYLFSLLSFGMGYLKMLVFENAITEHINTYDYTSDLLLAVSFLVVTIVLAVIGFAFYSFVNVKVEVVRRAENGDYECSRPLLKDTIDSLNILACEKNNRAGKIDCIQKLIEDKFPQHSAS